MKKLIAILACLTLCLSFTACGDSGTIPEDYDISVKTTGTIEVAVEKSEFITDSSGADALLIYVTFTNKTSKSQIFSTAVDVSATQGGEALTRAITDFSRDEENATGAKVESEGSNTVAFAFAVNDKETALELTMKIKSGEDKGEKTFTVDMPQ